MGEITRRQLIGSALVASGAVLGATALGGGAPAQQAEAQPLLIRGRGLSMAAPSFRKGTQPAAGDRMVVSGELTGANDDAAVGRFLAVYTAIGQPALHTGTAAASLEQHTFQFEDGTLLGSGLGSRDIHVADTFAIVGGTDRYAGVTGTYTALQRHFELGGDGSAEFLITLAR